MVAGAEKLRAIHKDVLATDIAMTPEMHKLYTVATYSIPLHDARHLRGMTADERHSFQAYVDRKLELRGHQLSCPVPSHPFNGRVDRGSFGAD